MSDEKWWTDSMLESIQLKEQRARLLASIPPGTVYEFKQGDLYCRCHGLTREELGAPESSGLRFWIPTAPPPAPDTIPEIPVVEPPEQEPTPIPSRRVRKCYVCARDPHEWPAVSRAPGEPAYCEEHRVRSK